MATEQTETVNGNSFLVGDIMILKYAAKYMGISPSCLYKKTMKREIPFSKPGGKLIYFRRLDLDAYMLSNQVKSKEQIKTEVEEKLSKSKHKWQ